MAIIQLLIEAIVVGICTLIFGVILGFIFMFNNTFLKSFKFLIFLFVLGFLLHVVFELVGANKKYCKDIYLKTKRIV